MEELKSSDIRGVKYEDGKLTIEFRSGRIYEYEDVEQGEYEDLLNAESAGGYFIDRGRQLIIHLFDNLLWKHNFDFKYFLEKGIDILDTTGRPLKGTKHNNKPVTIIRHNEVGNNEIKELFTELNGTLIRTADNRGWINFPVFVTGGASWLEAISSGLVYLHDTGDMVRVKAVQKLKRPIIAQPSIAGHADIGGDNILVAVTFTQGHGQFRADLPDRACYQYSFHVAYLQSFDSIIAPNISIPVARNQWKTADYTCVLELYN